MTYANRPYPLNRIQIILQVGSKFHIDYFGKNWSQICYDKTHPVEQTAAPP